MERKINISITRRRGEDNTKCPGIIRCGFTKINVNDKRRYPHIIGDENVSIRKLNPYDMCIISIYRITDVRAP